VDGDHNLQGTSPRHSHRRMRGLAWLVTFVIEFQAYFDFINAIEKDVKYNNARENL
jgi:hypothetical protein